ncbi:Uncharacterized protein HZ326_12466 [Fusarium oxysporum f. sp. albedinis]|nr:Uncharacterized protein HZ326_12466 [Fusarium oxysporum f. sp. albedinis]
MYLCGTICNPTQAHPHATWNGPARQGELDLSILIIRRVASSVYEAGFVFFCFYCDGTRFHFKCCVNFHVLSTVMHSAAFIACQSIITLLYKHQFSV